MVAAMKVNIFVYWMPAVNERVAGDLMVGYSTNYPAYQKPNPTRESAY